MATITDDYLTNLAPIYRDVLAAFFRFDPTRRSGDGLAVQSLYSVLDEQYTLGEVRAACLELIKGGALELEHEIFVRPTEMGEQLVEALTDSRPTVLPPFNPPEG
ncbi:MAG: hypothetical protein R3C99_07145 [Pirellulaceae bacterium]|nr:hypothetical protein [Planctomycetales bacterium]MCA9204157.1 hypothetical protein [Planctomycetales bacterium]MCA9220045.1 hypothetical protein [Planctomycetales bacterium]MCA9224003.1 hypothetical protein [Planctomycetales bacterium]